MNKIVLFAFFPFLINAQAPFKKLRVLFLGNSYTYVNNLPVLIQDLASAKGDTLVYDSYSPGGYSFYNHWNDANSRSKIIAGNWDYVILQAQSQEPSFPPTQVSSQTLPYAINLDTLIKHYNPCAHTVFYETWGRKFGDQSNCPGYPPLCTYTGMQNRLRDSYKLFADTTHDLMAPVGEAFRAAIASNTVIDLYQADQSHPSLEGSYLAAAVFYETLFQKSVMTSTYNPGLTTTTVSFLNQVAHTLMADSLALTNIPEYFLVVSFSFAAQNASDFQFTSATPAFSHLWYFGDGATSSVIHPIHTYTAGGSYNTSLEIYNEHGCRLDSVSKTVQVSLPTGFRDETAQALSLYPNPCSSELILQAGSAFMNTGSLIEVSNLMGQVLLSGEFTGHLNTSALKKGIYYIKISNSKAQSNSCFIKNE